MVTRMLFLAGINNQVREHGGYNNDIINRLENNIRNFMLKEEYDIIEMYRNGMSGLLSSEGYNTIR